MYVNIGQHIFLVFYAVCFGTMLTRISGLHAFPWGFFYENPRPALRLLWRLSISIACFYVLPAFVFGKAFAALGSYPDGLVVDRHAPLIAFSALSAFAPYRLYLVLAIILRETSFRLYSPDGFDDIIVQRHIRPSPTGHFLAFCFFASLLILDYWAGGLIG